MSDIEAIFKHQAFLLERFDEIEARNLEISLESPPLDLASIQGQERIRQYAWRLFEEAVETFDSCWHLDIERGHEELIDCLHFFVNLFILCGIPSTATVRPAWLIDYPDRPQFSQTWSDFVLKLGRAIHCLTWHPWKQKSPDKSFDRIDFEAKLIACYWTFLELCLSTGLRESQLYEKYMVKNRINHARIDSGV
jgi:dUTPase